MGDWIEITGSQVPENPSILRDIEEAIEEIDLETEQLIRDICRGIDPSEVIPTFRQFERRIND